MWVGLGESRRPEVSASVPLLSAFTCPWGAPLTPASQPPIPRPAFSWLSIHGARFQARGAGNCRGWSQLGLREGRTEAPLRSQGVSAGGTAPRCLLTLHTR